MKKLLSGKFLTITALGLVILILLTVGTIYLFDDNDSTFIKSGYVLNPLSEVSEKYFFEKDTGYHKNLSSMIEFNDVDDNDVSVLEDSFLHYSDESLSFLKNGAILDLGSIHGNDAVKFYNITSSSVINKDGNKYIIKTSSNDIVLDDFIGRINDNKYIVVGDLKLKVNGNSTNIDGDYFEIVYIEEGIVNIENKDNKYQVMAEGTLIYVGNDKVIDLGDKKITANGKDIMSITAITIDGNENIEIIPEPVVEEKSGNGTGTGGATGGNGEGTGTGNGTGTGGGGGNGGTGKGGIEDIKTEEITISLKEALIGSTNVDVTFDVTNNKEDDNFILQVVNLNSGRTVDMVASVLNDEKIRVNLLTPNTKYLFTVTNEKDGNKYFQKIFETAGFGIKLEKSYTTSNSIAYKVIIEEGTDITNAKLSLYKYNEETKKNEIVTTEYYDAESGSVKEVPKITNISKLGENIEGEYEIVYDGLLSDTIYTAVLDEFSVASSNFKDIYNITLTSMTLKKVPVFGKMSVTNNNGEGSFTLSLGEVIDTDNAITKYTYNIYDSFDNKLAINPIIKNNASPVTVKIGEDDELLKNDTNYYYKVVIEYFDNEKYIEYVISESINFMMGNDPYITVEANNDLVSYDKIGGTIYLADNSCLVSMPGRERCDGSSTTVLVVSKINPLTGELTSIYSKVIEFSIEEDTIKYDFEVSNLEEGTSYNIDVKAILNNDSKNERISLLHSDTSNRQITTKTLTSFYINWDTDNYSSDATHVINVGAKFGVDTENNVGTLSPEESMNSIRKIELKFYNGAHIEDIQGETPIDSKIISSDSLNIKEKFYDVMYNITSDGTFGYSLKALKEYGEGKLSEYYTVTIDAYYDDDGNNKVRLSNNIIAYEINRFLLLDNIEEPIVEVEGISNKASGKIFNNLSNEGTIVGYKLTAAFDRAGMLLNQFSPENINFYVYNSNKKKVSFYIMDDDKLKKVDHVTASLLELDLYEQKIYMTYGSLYQANDDVMSRGNSYYVGYELDVLVDGEHDVYPHPGPGTEKNYKLIDTMKETPNVKMYIAKSTENSIKYNYEIVDPDKSFYGEDGVYKFYYSINNGTPESVALNKTSSEVSTFSGSFIIDSLNNGDKYTLYYKKNISKTGNFDDDVVNYLEENDDGVRIFDGYYDANKKNDLNESVYNFKYEIINNQLADNKVTFKILATDNMLSRIISYRVNFTDSLGNKLDMELWQLNECDDGSVRCFSVDYVTLKEAGMKSDKTNENIISTSIEALYDNGLTGYEYVVGSSADSEFEYMIMQNNNTGNGMGNYVSFSKNGDITVWSELLNAPKGYYTYSINGPRISYKSKLNPAHSNVISYNLSSTGYMSTFGVLNPKMISKDNMESDNNKFSFNSITPKVASAVKSKLIDGAVVTLTLSGVDLNDLVNEGTAQNPEYYLYIYTWSDERYVGNMDMSYLTRPVVKVKINNSNPAATVTGVIDGLLQSNTYYYSVYANMYKDNEPYLTQLFDAGYTDRYESKIYSFTALRPNELYNSVDVSYKNSNNNYGDRILNMKFNLVPYINSIPYDFDLVYVFCDMNDITCGINGTNIFSRVIPRDSVNAGLEYEEDISEYDLEYGKQYYLHVYARINYYNGSGNPDRMIVYDVELNRFSFVVSLNKLIEPDFVATRAAVMTDDGEYALDFKINVSDVNHTIKDGKYYVSLVDEDGAIADGSKMQILVDDEMMTIADYSNYQFDVTYSNRSVRITGLEKDKMYTFKIYADAYINNYVLEDEELSKEEKILKRTKEYSQSYTVYTVNDYGVAFGNKITFSATERSIVATFLGGSNFDNVTKVRYTIGLWDGNSSSATSSGVYNIPEDKGFELSNTGDWRFIIDPSDMKNVLNQTYSVNLSFEIKHGDEFIWLTSADNSSFAGNAPYVKDNK